MSILASARNIKRLPGYLLLLLALSLTFTLLPGGNVLAASVEEVVTQVGNANLGSPDFRSGQEEATGYGFDISATMGDLGDGQCQLSVLGPVQPDEVQIMIDHVDSLSGVDYMQTTQLQGCEVREYRTDYGSNYGIGIGVILPDYFITVEIIDSGRGTNADLASAKSIAQQTLDGLERAGLLSQAAPDIEEVAPPEEPVAEPAPQTSGPATAEPLEEPGRITDTTNTMGVYNGPTAPTTLSIDRPHLVTEIHDYHWNDGQGATPGTIGLQDQNGNMYGPWPAVGTPGQGGVPNANWYVYPNIVIPAGTYTVIDSDPATWSQNTSSGGRGMGYVLATPHFEVTGPAPGEAETAQGTYPPGHSHSPAGVGSVGNIPGPSSTAEAVTGVVVPGLIATALGALGALGGGGFIPPVSGTPLYPTGGGPLPGAGGIPGSGARVPEMAQGVNQFGRRREEAMLIDTTGMERGAAVQQTPADQGSYIETEREAELFVQPEPLINDPQPGIFIDTIDMHGQAIDTGKSGVDTGILIDTADMFEGSPAAGAAGEMGISIEMEDEAALFAKANTNMEGEQIAFNAREGEAAGGHFAVAGNGQTGVTDSGVLLDTSLVEEGAGAENPGAAAEVQGQGAESSGTGETTGAYDQNGFDAQGYDRDGFNQAGYDRDGYNREGYDAAGFDKEGFDKAGFDAEGYDRDGFDKLGFDKEGYDAAGFDKEGFDKAGFDAEGYDRDGFDKLGFDKEGYDAAGFDKEGFDKAGFNAEGYDRDGFNQDGFDREGYGRNGYDPEGYDREGYDVNGYDRKGYNHSGFDAKGYDRQGYDKEGFNQDGWDRDGYDRQGFDAKGWDREGYDKKGYDAEGYDRDGYNREGESREGYDAEGYDENGFNKDGFDRDGYDLEGFDYKGYNRSGYDPWGYDRQGYGKDGYHWSGYNADGYDRDGRHWTENPYDYYKGSIWDVDTSVDASKSVSNVSTSAINPAGASVGANERPAEAYNPFDEDLVVDLGGQREAWKPTEPALGEPYPRTVEKYGLKPWTDEIPASPPEKPEIPAEEIILPSAEGPEMPVDEVIPPQAEEPEIPVEEMLPSQPEGPEFTPTEDIPPGEGQEPGLKESFPGESTQLDNTFEYTDPETGITSTYEYEPGYTGPRHGEQQTLIGTGDGRTYEIEFDAVTGEWINTESGNYFNPDQFESWQQGVAEDRRLAAEHMEKMASREDAYSKAIDQYMENWRKLEKMQEAADKYDIGEAGGPGDVDKAIQNLRDDMLAGKKLDQAKMDKIHRVINSRVLGKSIADTGERWEEDWSDTLGYAMEAGAATTKEVITGEKADGSTSWLGIGARVMIMGATGGLAGGTSLAYVTLDGAMNVAEAMYRIKDSIDAGESDFKAVSKAVGLVVLGEEAGWMAGEAGGKLVGEMFERFPGFTNKTADAIETLILKGGAKNQLWSEALGMVSKESAESSLDQINKRLVDIGSDQAAKQIIDSARVDYGLKSVADSFDDVSKGIGKGAVGGAGDMAGGATRSAAGGWSEVGESGGRAASSAGDDATRGAGRVAYGSDDMAGGARRAAAGAGDEMPRGAGKTATAADVDGIPSRSAATGGGSDMPGEPGAPPLNRGGRTPDEVLADPAAVNRAEQAMQSNIKDFDKLPPAKKQELINEQALYDEYKIQAEERAWNLADKVQRGEPLTVEEIMEMKADPASMRTLKSLRETDGLGSQLTPQEAEGIQREFNNVMDEYVHQPSYKSVEDHLHNRFPEADPEGIRVRTVRTPGTEPTDFNINTDNDVIAERLVSGPNGPEWVEVPKTEWEDTYYKALAENSGFSPDEAARRFPETDWANMDDAAQYRQWAKHHEEAAMDQFDLSAGRDFSDQRTWHLPEGDLPGRPMIEVTPDEIERGVDFVMVDGKPMRPSTGYELTQRGQGTMLDPEQLSLMEQHKFDDYWNAGDTPAQVMRNQTEAMEQLRKTANVAQTVERSYRDMGYRVADMPTNMKQAIAVVNNNDLSPAVRAARLQELGYESPGDFLNKVTSRIGSIRIARK